ncbi:LH1 [Ovine adenovirus 7]|uniref:LH1 n=1 Tax=Ovine adenovirus D serotype 7 (isolate OAV287) TaxID=114430 RepID=Q9QNN2_ADEO7|nr:LH1 [Ovine adenovirus 7]AAD45951.2 LH1 [Ovine adenovirus 7]
MEKKLLKPSINHIICQWNHESDSAGFFLFDTDNLYYYVLDQVSWICLRDITLHCDRMWLAVCFCLCKSKFDVTQYSSGSTCYVMKMTSGIEWIEPYLTFFCDFFALLGNKFVAPVRWRLE